LRYLDLTSVRLCDNDVKRLVNVSTIETLHLGNTDIGTDALCYLAFLKESLSLLHLQANPKIDDDAVPMLGALHNLRLLNIEGTSITMHGIRKLSGRLDRDKRSMRISMPDACEAYVQDLSSHYCLHLDPPLITSPDAVPSLSMSALRTNLAAHHAVNGKILPTGTKAEMAQRLTDILETRKLDLTFEDVCRRAEESSGSDTDSYLQDDDWESNSDITEVESRRLATSS